ncbi:MAG: IclR family transcriptional regulator, regulon repressor [Chloroflexota bacterium]|nr:IclR family transcriptional regulator, regulon repressor [Chloroflexota bacterium]
MPREGAQAVDRACALLNAFSPQEPSLGLKELAERAKINKSTAHRLLNALSTAGLVQQDPQSREYAPGTRLLALASIVLEHLDLPKLAATPMARLVGAVKEAAYLATYTDGGTVYVAVVEGPSTVRLTARPGMVLPYHSTATGKVLLAALTREELNRRLPRTLRRLTPKTLGKRQLVLELRRVTEQGCAISYEEQEEGVCSVAVPVRDHSGVVAALAISGPSYRLSREKLAATVPRLRAAAGEIGVALGATAPKTRRTA